MKKETLEIFGAILVLALVFTAFIFLASPTKPENGTATVLGTRTGRLTYEYYVIIDAGEFGVVPVQISAEEYFGSIYTNGNSVAVSCKRETKGSPYTCEIEE